jgi:GT2 family glycosyltransferase
VRRSIHVIVVAYHGADALDRCLAGLGGRLPTTVVDNSSSPTVRSVASRHAATYIDSGANVGFAAGVNLGLRNLIADAPADVLLLNPDAVIAPKEIRKLSAVLEEHPECCVVAPRLISPDGVEQRGIWPLPTPMRSWLEALGLGRLPSRSHFAVGAALLIARDALRDVGLFDERFFLYAEEADWQRRALRRGWRTLVCPHAVAIHVGAGMSWDTSRRESLFHAGQETYIRKWHGAVGWWVYRLAVIAGSLVRALVLPPLRRGEARRRVILYLRGPRRSAGLPRLV